MLAYSRKSKKLISLKKRGLLKFLYTSFIGRLLLKVLVNKKISILYGKYNDSRLSCYKIKKFIKDNNINMREYKTEKYDSFNNFFTRNIILSKRPMDIDKNKLISVADSKLTVYKINEDLMFEVKSSKYSIESLIKNKTLARGYKNGLCLVFRLDVDDFHRYCYLDNGNLLKRKYIDGFLHTVNPVVYDKHKVFAENCREYSVLETENFGTVVQIEVGALMVGKITNNNLKEFKKGEEKGYFSFGGSTIIILIKDNQVKIDDDILKYSKVGIETIVKYRESIGVKNNVKNSRRN